MQLERADRERLSRITDFLQEELEDFKREFLEANYKSYKDNRDIRRNM